MRLPFLIEQFLARKIDVSQCRSVCLALGPYRNLTTMTAATLFLHPECQVLNHAGGRIYGNRRLDFFAAYSPERFQRFLRHAVYLSRGGGRGNRGGSIVHSHAFDPEHETRKEFERSGQTLLKTHIRSLFWKESLRTNRHIRACGNNLSPLLEAEPRLRFLMPVRNPLDCAVSNLKTGHAMGFEQLQAQPHKMDVHEVVAAVLDEIRWFADWQAQYPERFFSFTELEISRAMLEQLAGFLELSADSKWLDQAEALMVTKGGYAHEHGDWAFFRDAVQLRFADHPEWKQRLLAFLPANAA